MKPLKVPSSLSPIGAFCQFLGDRLWAGKQGIPGSSFGRILTLWGSWASASHMSSGLAPDNPPLRPGFPPCSVGSRTINVLSYCNDVVCGDHVIISGHNDQKIRFWDSR